MIFIVSININIVLITNKFGHFIKCILVVCITHVMKSFSFIWWILMSSLSVMWLVLYFWWNLLHSYSFPCAYGCIASILLLGIVSHSLWKLKKKIMWSLCIVSWGLPQSYHFEHYKYMWWPLNLCKMWDVINIFFKDFPN